MEMRYACAMQSLAILGEAGHVDLSKDEIDFLSQEKIWLAKDRARARRNIEAYAYGGLDLIGIPRFPLPVEFIAAAIYHTVHEVNWMVACVVMAGAEFTEDVLLEREAPVKPEVLFSHLIRFAAGFEKDCDHAQKRLSDKAIVKAEKE